MAKERTPHSILRDAIEIAWGGLLSTDFDPRDFGDWLWTRAQEVPPESRARAVELVTAAQRAATAMNRQECTAAISELKRLGPSMPIDHHYVPQFYLRQWTNADGKLEETRFHRGSRVSRRCFPSETAYVAHLYSFREGLMVKQTNPAQFETTLFGPIDQAAALVHRKLLEATPTITAQERTDWATFLNSLYEREPRIIRAREEQVKAIALRIMKEELERAPDDESRMRWMQGFRNLNSEVTARNTVLVGMRKSLGDLDALRTFTSMNWKLLDGKEFITSDRPLVPFRDAQGVLEVLTIPLSPERLMVLHRDGFECAEGEIAATQNEMLFHARPSAIYSRAPLTEAQGLSADTHLDR